SPPTITPVIASRNATEKMPAEPPLVIGVAATFQVMPPSVERNTRAAPPPVPIQALRVPCTTTLVPLAANAASPLIASGIPEGGTSVHVAPPSVVRIIGIFPSTGSLNATPFLASQNAMPSKKPLGLRLVNCSVQFLPPSEVL